MTVKDQYFRQALGHLSGFTVPEHFKFEPASDAEADEQQEWAVDHVQPKWACGISLLEAARVFVDDAKANGNILGSNAAYAADFEVEARKKGKI